MPAAQQPTLGEIGRLIEALRTDTTDRFDKIDVKFDRLDSVYVRKETYDALDRTTDALITGLQKDVDKLQNTLSWLLRAIGVAVMGGLVGAFFAASKFLGGP